MDRTDMTPFAEAEAMQDVDAFTDWLYGECINKTANAERTLRMPHRILEADVPTLVNALLIGDAEDVLAARDRLRAIYLNSSSEYVQRMLDRMMEAA